ncbi:hypothetical protein LPJ66_005934, partial [Kickxella alabastrina]
MDKHTEPEQELELELELEPEPALMPLRFQQHWEQERSRRRSEESASASDEDAGGSGLAAQDGGLAAQDGALAAQDGALAAQDGALAAQDGALAAQDGALAAQGFADFVVSFRYDAGRGVGNRGVAEARAQGQLGDVVKRLVQAGLHVEVRAALVAERRRGRTALREEKGHLLVFVTCPRARLVREWQRSRLQDWLGGMLALRRAEGGGGEADPLEVDAAALDDPARLLSATGATADSIPVAERQRLVHRLIAGASGDGGAAVGAGGGGGGAAVAVVALHDGAFNRRWVRVWARKWLVSTRDLQRIREHFGEEVAMYFAFLQSYFLWLALPAAAGAAWWACGRSFAWPFAVLLVVWAAVFTETWARRESDIATYWGVHGVQRAGDARRAGFRPDGFVLDAATGEPAPVSSGARRWARRGASAAAVVALAAVLAALVAAIFAVQTFASEFYAGPLASVLALAPVVLLTALLPLYTGACTRVAYALTEYENY